MNFNIENVDSFVVVTDIETGKEVKRFNCPVIVECFDADCCGNAAPYFKLNGYIIDSSDISQINGEPASLYGGQKAKLNAIMADCECCGGGEGGTVTNPVTPELLESLIETSGAGVLCLASKPSRKGTVEIIRLEDGTLDKYVWHEIGGLGAVLETASLTDYVICPNEAVETTADLREFTPILAIGDTSIPVDPKAPFDAIQVVNCSNCPILLTAEVIDDASTDLRKIWLSPNETRVLDWESDAIGDIEVGGVILPSTSFSSDSLSFSPVTEETKIRITFFNS